MKHGAANRVGSRRALLAADHRGRVWEFSQGSPFKVVNLQCKPENEQGATEKTEDGGRRNGHGDGRGSSGGGIRRFRQLVPRGSHRVSPIHRDPLVRHSSPFFPSIPPLLRFSLFFHPIWPSNTLKGLDSQGSHVDNVLYDAKEIG